jgi:Cdc6-like AAA superfamily ATPase
MTIDPKKLFFPNKSIRQENKEFFAGRRDLLKKACMSVGRDEFSAVVFGDRGIGKTSFGWQLLELLSGDFDVLKQSLQPLDLKEIAELPKLKCIWLQCQSYMENIEGVLLSILKESTKDHSLSSEFPKVYSNKKVKDTIQRKYKIDLGVISAEFLFAKDKEPEEHRSHKTVIQDLFREVVGFCKESNQNQPVIIFIDEFDSLPDRTGVGQLIESIEDVRFVIIGIADNIDEIIKDHESANRKLADSKIKLPRLSSTEINSIFNKAEQESQGEILFDQAFREAAIFRSYGYPFLVQQFGFFALRAVLDARLSKVPIVIGVDYLREAIDRLFKDKSESVLYRKLIENLQGDAQAKKEILKVVADHPDYISIEDIKNKISGRLKRFVVPNIDNLVADKILRRTEDNRIRFTDPEARILVQLHFANENPPETEPQP